MNTALAGVAGMTGSPPHRADWSKFPVGANVLSLQARRDQFPIVIRGQGVINVLPPCGKAVANYVVEDAHGEERDHAVQQ